jgi:glycyl-tRNA synthetase (class II)
MRFLPNVAPFKCGVFPLSANKELFPPLHRLDAVLTEAGISTKLDTTSVSIGRRYARTGNAVVSPARTNLGSHDLVLTSSPPR